MSDNDRRVLFNRTRNFQNHRWSVAREGIWWSAFDPDTTDEWSFDSRDDMFDTFAEAIEYAQKQARA